MVLFSSFYLKSGNILVVNLDEYEKLPPVDGFFVYLKKNNKEENICISCTAIEAIETTIINEDKNGDNKN